MTQVKTLQPAVKETIINAVAGTGASNTFGLPARPCYLAWQTSFGVAPAAVSITIQVSLDNSAWTTIDTSTAVGGEVRTITAPTAAIFVRANVGTNTGGVVVTVQIIAKPAD